jgi:Xaa-Pro aminopeptidase
MNADFFVENRKRLRELFTGTAPIIMTANGLLQRNSDVTYPFRQDSSFWYFTGIEEPDIVLVMDKDKEYLIVPERDTSRQAFDGAIDIQALSKSSGIEQVLPAEQGWKQLGTRLKKVKHIATVAPAPDYLEHHGIYTNPARSRLLSQIREHNSDVELLDLRDHITRLRMIKQPLELDCIRSAINITANALTSLKKRGWDRFEYEYQLESAITDRFNKKRARHAYSPIVASGGNACTLHYVHNSGLVQKNAFILLDVGAEVSNYAADITRTYAVGTVSKRHRSVYEAVLAVQEHAFELLKPGITVKEFEHKVQQFMGEKLRELGLIKSIESDEVRKYYPHATSHFLGLDVHDVGDYERPLEPGMVMTVEPGIYIPEENIGVRIEDNVVITESGIENLSLRLSRVLE